MAISPRNLIKLSQSSSKSDERPQNWLGYGGGGFETSLLSLLLCWLYDQSISRPNGDSINGVAAAAIS